ncbi:MAG TPA: reverse transcriptase family protein, partial [Aequorivita sp.]|nr:reverse transcriptase family protein [Aequorivita sp.]
FVIDIKNYFESIKINTVRTAFENLGFNKLISEKLSKIVTYKGKLIQGFHTSPTLANIVFHHIDNELEKSFGNVTYTRYADDLYFSADTEFDIEDDVRQILRKNAFEINPKKTKMMRRGWHQYVTGLTVFDNIQPRIPKRIKRWLRFEIYYIHQFGYLEHVLHKLQVSQQDYEQKIETKNRVDSEISYLQRRLDGWLLFINSIEPDFAKKKSKLLEESLENFPL